MSDHDVYIDFEEHVEAIRKLARKLQKLDACAASSIERQPCITQEVHYIGREILRRLGEIKFGHISD